MKEVPKLSDFRSENPMMLMLNISSVKAGLLR